jgi:hypothetical protein
MQSRLTTIATAGALLISGGISPAAGFAADYEGMIKEFRCR